jgi:hypothetical protein
VAPRRVVIIGLLALGAAAAGAAAWLMREPTPEPAPTGARLPSRGFPGGGPIRAEEITEGRLSPERLPLEVNAALEAHSTELIRNAEAIEQKQARITGTCAPGSAIRVIGEDGSVSCQRLPRGIVSVTALAGVPRLATTGTAQGSVTGGVGRFQTGGEDDFLVVPITLPDGAEVTGFKYVFYDADERVDGAAYLYRSDDQPMSALATSASADEVRVVSTEEVKLRRVDAGRYAYFVYFQLSAEAGANLVPISASVTYRLP